MNNLHFRNVNQHDVNFILNSLMQGVKDYNVQHGIMSYNFFDNFKEVIKLLLEQNDSLIVCDVDEPDVIYGYCIYSNKTLHYVYVKHSLRRFGVAKALILQAIGGLPEYYTIQSKMSNKITQKYNIKFNPYFLITGVNK